MTTAEKTRILKEFAGKRILVIGDVMLDVYVWGDVQRISPEAPVPVVEMRRRSCFCGGAGNVAANLVSLGAQVSVAGVTGDDADGVQLRNSLGNLGIAVDGLVADGNRPTTTKLRVMAHSQQIVRLDSELRLPLDEAAGNKLLSWIEGQLPGMDGCVVSDYNKGVVSSTLARRVVALANEARKPVVVDPKGVEFDKYRGATVVTPNSKEAFAVLNREFANDGDVTALGPELVNLLGGSAVVITQGEHGMTVFPPSGASIQIPAVAKNVYDVTGAGDTVVSVLAMALAAGAPLDQAARLANEAAGLVVGKLGTAVVSVDELLRTEDDAC